MCSTYNAHGHLLLILGRPAQTHTQTQTQRQVMQENVPLVGSSVSVRVSVCACVHESIHAINGNSDFPFWQIFIDTKNGLWLMVTPHLERTPNESNHVRPFCILDIIRRQMKMIWPSYCCRPIRSEVFMKEYSLNIVICAPLIFLLLYIYIFVVVRSLCVWWKNGWDEWDDPNNNTYLSIYIHNLCWGKLSSSLCS